MEDENEKPLISFSGCETSFTTISLINFVDELVGVADIEYTKQQISRNQDRLLMVQNQLDPAKFFKQKGLKLDFGMLGKNGGMGADGNLPEGHGGGQ